MRSVRIEITDDEGRSDVWVTAVPLNPDDSIPEKLHQAADSLISFMARRALERVE
jgi:hypothetical protein